MPSAPIAMNSRCGKRAPILKFAVTLRVPSAFITTIRQSPLFAGHFSVCCPAPTTLADQMEAVPGRDWGAPPRRVTKRDRGASKRGPSSRATPPR
jgi:hypothetical protein